MAHSPIAALWEQLRKHDLSNILRELVGQHALELSTAQQNGSLPDVEASIQLVFWIKSFFDLQRAYLQGNTSYGHSDPLVLPHMLPSDLIYSTIMFLIQLKTSILPSHTATMGDFSQQRLTILETILSGLRVILLRKDTSTSEKKQSLLQSLQTAWTHGRLGPLERCLVFEVLPEAIDQMLTTEIGDSSMSAFDVRLPPWSTGPRVLSINYATFVTDALKGLEMEDGNRILAFYALYDVLWATEVCIIRSSISVGSQDIPTSSQSSIPNIRAGNEARQMILEQPKRSLLGCIASLQSQSNSSKLATMVGIVTSTLITDAELAFSDGSTASGLILPASPVVAQESVQSLLSWTMSRKSQKQISMREWEAALLDLEFSMKDWAQKYTVIPNEDLRKFNPAEESTYYIVNCGVLHPVPKCVLRKALEGVDKLGLEDLSNDVPFAMLRAWCPLCPAKTSITSARRLEPLERVSKTLRQRADAVDEYDDASDAFALNPPQTPIYRSESPSTSSLSASTSFSSLRVDRIEQAEPPLPPLPTVPDLGTKFNLAIGQPPIVLSSMRKGQLAPAPSMQTLASKISSSNSKKTQKAPVELAIRNPLRPKTSSKDSSRKPVKLPNPPRFCFSSAGNSLLLWGQNCACLVRFEMNRHGNLVQTIGYKVTDVDIAAAGRARCVVMAGDPGHKKLSVFQEAYPYPDATIPIEDSAKPSVRPHLAVSSDDRYAALTLNDKVLVYGIGLRNVRHVVWPDQMEEYQIQGSSVTGALSALDSPLPYANKPVSLRDAEPDRQSQKVVIERKINFSADGSKLIIATHLADQRVYIDVWDCTSEPFTISPEHSRVVKLPPWSPNDENLTSFFYDDQLRSVFLTAFMSKEMPNRFSIPGYNQPESEYFLAKAVHGAQSPAGSRFTSVNSMNEIWLVEYRANDLPTKRRLKKSASKIPTMTFRPNQIACGMPAEGIIMTFWVKDPCLMLRTTQVSDGEIVRDMDLRSEYERAVRDISAENGSLLESPVDLGDINLIRGSQQQRKPAPVAEMSGTRTPLELPATESRSWFSSRRR